MGSEGGQTPHQSARALPAHKGCCPRTPRPCCMAAWHRRHAATPQPKALSIPQASAGIAAPQHHLPCPVAQGEPAHSPAALVLRMPQSPAEQNTRSRHWGLGAVAEEPRFMPGTSGVPERGRHRAALPEGSGQCPGRGDAAKGQGGRSGGPGTIAPANAPQQQGSKHRSYLAAPWPATLSPLRGAPAAMPKTSSLPARFCKPAALTLPTPPATPQADPAQSQTRATAPAG